MSSVQAGLFIVGKRTPLPLKDVSVKASVNGYLVGLDSTLKYSNEGADPLEVVFRFPVEESFAVVGLEAVISGRRIKAQIKEKEEARQMYDDAMASGFTAALAEEKSGDIFSISLGNLPPKTDAELHLQLAGELPIDAEGAVRFALPSVLKPRYTPAGSSDPIAALGAGDSGLGQVEQASAPAVFKFSLEVAGEDGVSSVSSPTHTVTTERKEGRVCVTLADDSQPLDKDLVILVQCTDPHAPKAIAEPADPKSGENAFLGSPAIMVNFFPEFKSSSAACEFIFLIDRSGSMDGSFIKSARDTLLLFLKSIPPGCHFNIVGFGSSFRFLFPQSVPYNQENLDKAVQHTGGIRADMGGTELLPPLQQIYKQPLLPGLPRQVFVLTDGSVSNTHACTEEVKKNVKHARCFTFGIGSGASTELVRGLARAGNGTAEFVQSGERMQPKVISSLRRALQPSVTDLTVDFQVPGDYEVLQAPCKPPTIFSGDKTVVYGVLKRKSPAAEKPVISGTVTLRGQSLGEKIEFSLSFQIPQSPESQGGFAMPIVHHLAAKSLIRDWQGGEGLTGLPSAARKKEIIGLSIDSSVVSSHTAYIAVDEEQDKPIEGAIKTWDIAAFGAMQERDYSPVYASAALCSFSSYSSDGGEGMAYENMELEDEGEDMDDELEGVLGECFMSNARVNVSAYSRAAYALPPLSVSASTASSDHVSALVSLQKAEGTWSLDASLASVFFKSLQELESACPIACEGAIRVIWATVLALVFLEVRFAGQQDEWGLVALKAEMWLTRESVPSGTSVEDLKTAAKAVLLKR